MTAHETTAQALSERAEFRNDALAHEIDRVRTALMESLRQKVTDAGWNPYADNVTVTLHLGQPDPDTNKVTLTAEATRPAPEWVPYVEPPPLARCDGCGRSTWSAEEVESGVCRMPQPSSRECGGTWVAR